MSAKAIKTLVGTAEGQSASAVAEDNLRYFHVDYGSAVRKLGAGMRIKLYGNLDTDFVGKRLMTETAALCQSAVRACAANYHTRLQRMLPDTKTSRFQPRTSCILG